MTTLQPSVHPTIPNSLSSAKLDAQITQTPVNRTRCATSAHVQHAWFITSSRLLTLSFNSLEICKGRLSEQDTQKDVGINKKQPGGCAR